ncbi:MAG: hypothetical protein AAGA96_13120 [Verrucomicrobiota bacterium]
MKKNLLNIGFSLVILFALTGCGDEGGESNEPAAQETGAGVDSRIEAVFTDMEIADAMAVTEVRTTAKPGEEVVVAGKIAGTMKPFAEGFATLVLGDLELHTCDLNPDENCPTPWDACCEEPEVLKAMRLTVQIVDEENRPIGQGLKGVRGLKEMDEITVKGLVTEGSDNNNVIINVTALSQTVSS